MMSTMRGLVLLAALCSTNAFVPPSPSFVLRCSSRCTSSTSLFASILKKLPESAVEVTLQIPGVATQAAYDKACGELSREIEIPGFRKGSRIPPAVLESNMAAKGGKYALREQAIKSLLAELIEPALKEEHNLEPIGQPTLTTSAEELASSFEPGQDLELGVKCDVWPDIEWTSGEKPYIGLEATYKRRPFNQAKLDQALLDLRDRYAVLEKMEDDGRELQMGDACVVNMEGYMATPDGTKGEALPNAASGDSVEVILGKGRYMEGLVEGLIGAKVGDTRTVSVSFPVNLRDKTLAGKQAIFDVTVLEASTRTLPEVTDEFANKVRAGLTAETMMEELKKAVDEEDSKEFKGARNQALGDALAQVLSVEVPDTLVTNQAKEKFAVMMTEMRDNGVPDEEIKKQIEPENFLKYKDIVKEGIVKEFQVTMACDEIARLEGIQVPEYQVEEQMEAIKKDAQGEKLDEASIRPKVESTLLRQMVFDFLAENANLNVEYTEEEEFDEAMMQRIADESLEREEKLAAEAASTDE